MARVKLLQKEEVQPKAREIYDKIEEGGARIINLYRALAHSPSVLHNFTRLGNSLLSRAELSPKLRELVILRIARLTGSEYEWAQHYPVALEVGVTREQAEAISHWSYSTKFSDEERAVLQYTDEVTQDVEVKDKTFKTLQQYLNEQCIVELTASIGYWGMVARFLVPLQIDIDAQPAGSARDLTGRKS
jgi:4-carboxymuconolactone decarboxylase